MQDKILALLIYGLLGLMLALSPLFVRDPQANGGSALTLARKDAQYRGPVIIAMAVLLLFIYTQANVSSLFSIAMIVLSLGFSFPHRMSLRDALLGFSATLLACVVSGTLPWWRRQPSGIEITAGELLLFVALLTVAGSILLSQRSMKPVGRIENAIVLGSYAVVAVYISYSMAAMADLDATVTLWHHWGAYIEPSEVAMAGARLFYDIPAQYGAGPTLLLKSLCGSDCWAAAYWIIGTATFAYAMLIGAMMWLVASGGRYRNILALLFCVVTCMLWNAYPPAVASPNITPSTTGMRFLPVVMLTTWILFTPNRNFVFRNIGGHLLWILGALWSPESLFYVTAVWWPIYLFDCSRLESDQASRVARLGRAASRLILLAAGVVLVVYLGYYAIYGVFAVPRYFAAYAIYPPGPLPINVRGTLWYFVFSMALATYVAWSGWRLTGNTIRFRRSLVLLLLAFATFSYYLGRSHDNNLLNLAPFIMLVLQNALMNARGVFVRQAIAISLASLLAWVAVFGWGTWQKAYQAGHVAEFGFSSTRAKLSYGNSETRVGLQKRNPAINQEQIAQTSQLMEGLSKRGEPFVVMDQNFLLQPDYPSHAWSAIQSATNFEYFPSPMRREFLWNTAGHLHRSGWLIIARSHDLNTWLDDFDAVYDRTGRIDLDSVYAIRFSPKP